MSQSKNLYNFFQVEAHPSVNESLRQIADSIATVDSEANGGGNFLTNNGAPSPDLGSNGSFYFRKDGPPGSRIYFKSSGVWGAIV